MAAAAAAAIDCNDSGRTLPQHRKTAVSFRDTSLLRIFQIALTALQQLKARAMGTLDPKQVGPPRSHMLPFKAALCYRHGVFQAGGFRAHT
jgi:hypothetical protein